MNVERPFFPPQAPESQDSFQKESPETRSSVLKNPDTYLTDKEVLDQFFERAKEDETTQEETVERQDADAERRFIDIAGKRVKVDAYSDAWRQKAEKYQKDPRPVESQLDTFMTKLKRVIDHAESAKRQLTAIREVDAGKETGRALTAEVEGQISEKLLPFQSFFEYEAVLNSMSETMDEVTALAYDSVRSGDNSQLEATRSYLASSENLVDENR